MPMGTQISGATKALAPERTQVSGRALIETDSGGEIEVSTTSGRAITLADEEEEKTSGWRERRHRR